ncbi:hypothetical protein Tco_0689173 [Tanacetum coccineum]
MAKDTWETLKTIFMGVDMVKTTKVQTTLKVEFQTLGMKDTKIIDDFALEVNIIVSNIRALGEKVEEAYVVKKLLCVVLSKLLQIAYTIEHFADLDNITVEEVIGWLKAHEERVRRKKLSNVADSITVIVNSIIPFAKRRSVRSVIAKLAVAACSYFEEAGEEVITPIMVDIMVVVPIKTKIVDEHLQRNHEDNLTQNDDEPALLLAVRHEVKEVVFSNEKHLTPKLRNLNEESNTLKVWYLDNKATTNPGNLGRLVAGDRFPGRHVARDRSSGKARRGYVPGRLT